MEQKLIMNNNVTERFIGALLISFENNNLAEATSTI